MGSAFKAIDGKRDGLGSRTFSITDIGSDNIKTVFLKCDGPTAPPEVIFSDTIPAQIGLNTTREDRTIRSRSFAPGKRAVVYIDQEARRLGIKEHFVVATASVRHAPNQEEFLTELEKSWGRTIDWITGEEEATLVRLGVEYVAPGIRGNIINIGGCSMQVSTAGSSNSYPTEIFLGSLMLKEYRRLNRDLIEIIDEELETLSPTFKERGRQPLIVTSGLFRAVGKVAMASMGKVKLSQAFPYGKAFDAADFKDALEAWKKFTPEKVQRMVWNEREKVGVSRRLDKIEERADTIDIGRLVLMRTIKLANPTEIIFSNGNLRKGIAYAVFNQLDVDDFRSVPLAAKRLSSQKQRVLALRAS